MSSADLRALVENAPDAIVVSRDGIVLYANAAAARLLGHDDVSTIVGRPMTFLDRASVEVMRRRSQQMAASGEPLVPREYPAKRRDGSEITAEIASTIIDFDGAPAVLAYARDVTERSRLRKQLAHADRLASLGMMAAGVAHEINNPLAVIALAADGLSHGADPARSALVAEVRTGVQRIASIVRDLRSYGRDDEDAAGPVDVASTVAAAERLVSHELRPRGTLVNELGELPSVMGVARHLEQVFVNLLLNAAHALDDRTEGKVTLRARATDDQVVVSVEDDGHGIPEEHLGVVFEPFFTTRAEQGGTGLGLSICRDLVTRIGGSIAARSTVGRGTTVEVCLPRATSAPAGAPTTASPAPPPIAPRATGAKPRVLVVDDEPLIVQSLKRVLAPHADVTGEGSPEKALARLLADPPFDVVLCDVMMPGMTGTDLHERITREKPALAARFVFITGGTYTARTRDYLTRVKNTTLLKPFSNAAVVETVLRVAAAKPTG